VLCCFQFSFLSFCFYFISLPCLFLFCFFN
jgi:hypothetical protein